MRWLILALAILVAPVSNAALPGACDARTDPPWAQHVRQAQTALELGDRDGSLTAIDALDAARPSSPLPPYLRARLAESGGAWAEACIFYQEVFASPERESTPEWIQLAAGRWVRAQHKIGESRLRAVMAEPDSQRQHAGRCLILPLEPLILGEQDASQEAQLRVLGVAAAAWINAALTQMPGMSAVDIHTASLLTRVLASRGARVTAGSFLKPLMEECSAPPVTTTLGVSYRLAKLAPSAPPPWTPEATRPAHYLVASPSGEWTDEAARALAHFQAEHDLAPTGNLDPQTRLALEGAYRRDNQRLLATSPGGGWTDPAQVAARLLGAEALLTGTLEAAGSNVIRWNVVWVSPEDGSSLSASIDGVLPAAHFQEAWVRMVRMILKALPACAAQGDCSDLVVAETPDHEGLLAYGNAVLLTGDEEHPEDAAFYFRQAARRGAGDRARWYAMAWSATPKALDALERRLVQETILGRPRFEVRFLRSQSLSLAGGLLRHPLPEPVSGPLLLRDPGLTYFPRTSWLKVIGRAEGP
ncbi:MAG: hypothetical protein KAY24_10355 [Candidatus Eisenbacteria sp.]|nr:hypothetical protein [Candidatus Eisenbacteria bacterium]